MDIRTSKVEAAAVLGESSKRIGPGQFVDLDESFANGTLRDVFHEDLFEPMPGVASEQQTNATEEPAAPTRAKAKREKA